MEGNLKLGFSVRRDEVLKRVATNSYYRGERVKEESGAHAARMQSGSDNYDILLDELNSAASDVVAIITRNLGRCVYEVFDGVLLEVDGAIMRLTPADGGNYTAEDGRNIYIEETLTPGNVVECRDTAAGQNFNATVLLPDATFNVVAASNFPEELTASVEGAIAAYLANKTLEGWMLVNMPAEVGNLAERSIADAEKLRMILVERKKPVR